MLFIWSVKKAITHSKSDLKLNNFHWHESRQLIARSHIAFIRELSDNISKWGVNIRPTTLSEVKCFVIFLFGKNS